MNKIRKYSIIVVTYNNAEGLSHTLQSIRSLDYNEKETIVIDGASKDNTQEILTANKDIITIAVSEKDSGIYNAMNKGIKFVSGDYVVFMNAGDCFAHSGILSLVNNYEGDILLGGETYGGKVRMVKKHMSLYDILSIGINHQAVYYRRTILQKYGFDESYRLIADLKSVVEPLAKEKVSIICIPEILAICEGGGVSKQQWRDAIVEKQRIIDEVVDSFYKRDYQKFARINNTMLSDFIVLSQFQSLFPLLRILSKLARFFNDRFKHIPIDNIDD
jgi:glycosyltransferase involved in cell wall biosynthesis